MGNVKLGKRILSLGAEVHRADRRTLGGEWRLTGAIVCVITVWQHNLIFHRIICSWSKPIAIWLSGSA